MQTETHEKKPIISESDFMSLGDLLQKYNDTLMLAIKINASLCATCDSISHNNWGELNDYFGFKEQQKKLELLLAEFQCKIVKMENGLS